MTITSINYVLFTALAIGVYYFLSRRLQNNWLLLVSYIFIITWDWKFAIVLGVITTFNFLIAPQLRINVQGRRGLLWLGIAVNVSALVLFRAANFFYPNWKLCLVLLACLLRQVV